MDDCDRDVVKSNNASDGNQNVVANGSPVEQVKMLWIINKWKGASMIWLKEK